jgi:putative oxidoreductase
MSIAALETRVTPYFDWADVLGRVGLALLFLWSGYSKFAYMAANVAYMNAYGIPAAELLIGPAALFELVAGAMLALGWKARWVALLLAAYSAVAALIFHAYWSVPADQVLDQQIHFMKNVAIVGGLLFVFARGPARFAIDTGTNWTSLAASLSR